MTWNLIVTGPFAAVAVTALVARLPRAPASLVACALAVLLGIGCVRATRVAPVAYDHVAASLVAEGWRPGDPIVVDGNVYALWGPLEWYLPGRPALVLRRGALTTSSAVFVVRGTRVTRTQQTTWRHAQVLE